MQQADGVSRVDFVDAVCGECGCPIKELLYDGIPVFHARCHLCRELMLVFIGSAYWRKVREEEKLEIEHINRLRSGADYFGE